MWGNQKFHSQRILQSQYKSLNENIDFFQFKNINSNDAFLKIKELNPSLVIVLGTRIIKEELFENIDCEFINIHWGMSPFYRGDGIITPIYQNNWEKLGFTIHILDSGIDSAMDFRHWQSNTAEVMIDHVINGTIMNTNNNGDAVFGFCSATCVAKFIGCIASAQPGDDITAAINQIHRSN